MKTIIEKILNEYISAKQQRFAGHPMGTFFRNKIPGFIYNTGIVDVKNYLITGSVGQGQWATVPWVCIFDRKITTSATKGVYIVYLLSKDGKTLYLTFNQGCTEIRNSHSKSETIQIMREKAAKIAKKIDSRGFASDENIDLGSGLTELAELYQKGTIFYKAYHQNSVPSNDVLLSDLRKMMDIYKEYSTSAVEDSWWPSKEEYDPGISKEKWIELLNDSAIFTESALNMIAEFYTFGGTATCAQLAEHYGRTYNYYLMTSVHLAERIVKSTGCPVMEEERNAQNAKWWPVLYVGKDASKDEKGSFIWKIREELCNALTEFGIEKYLPNEEDSKLGKFDSWEIIDETIAIKTCDKSFFEYNGSGVPKEICWFFDAENIPKGGSVPVNLIFGDNSGKSYKGVLKNDSTDRRRIQIRWNSDLGKSFAPYKEKYAKAKFVKTNENTYEVYIYEENTNIQKDSWLLAWNPNSWDWEDLQEACELTQKGEKYTTSWSCASNSVKVGDRVYIIVLGTADNGIMASGYAVSEQYEYEHWDEQKRAEGKKNKGIDIELEYIINPEIKKPLAQSLLKNHYPEQHWSPQASGISIKEQYAINLYEEWLNYIWINQGGEEKMTVLDNVIKALKALGGKGTYAQIYEAYENVTNQILTDGKKAGIRKTVEDNSSDSENFKGKDIFYSVEGKGKGVWGLRDYLPQIKKITTKDKINAIKTYIAAKGFNYEGDLIENFYLSLKSKPFVILAGTSGTGKTRLVKLFAEAIGAEMQLVPVRPDWSDSSDLFGHLDLNGDFKKGAIIDFVKDASEHLTKPYFLCFDEMNLARVEHYMSDILSVIETRDFDDNKKRITTSPLIEKDFCRCSNGRNEYGELRIPENLYIIGTVNMDETTFPFSKKVLDRANTIEFSFVDLMSKPVRFEAIPQKLNEDNSFLKTEYLYLLDCDDSEVVDTVCFDLEALNHILVKANLHVGYRVRDEISFYMMNNKKAGLLSEEAAFDNEIMQKILPRVQGSSAAIKDVLSELFVKCAGDFSGFGGVSVFEQMNSYINQKDCKYPNSAKKIAFMMRRYEEDGFTSYWL